MKSFVPVFLVLVLIGGFAPESARSCSVCMCGDKLFCMAEQNTASRFLSRQGSLRLNLETVYTSKSNGLSESEGSGTEDEHEFRPSLRASYGITDWFAAAVKLPLSFKRIEAASPDGRERQTSSGLGDAEFSTVLSRVINGSASTSYVLGLAAALKVPTGNSNLQRDGQRADEHLQSGTGSYDWQAGLALGQVGGAPAIFGSLYYRRNGTNSHDYHYGNAVLYNAGLQSRVSSVLTLSAEVNGRFAKQDRQGSQMVENTGGSVLYCSPGVKVAVQESMSFLVNLQVPVYHHLYGTQTEKAVLNAGVNLDVL